MLTRLANFSESISGYHIVVKKTAQAIKKDVDLGVDR
jgi:hypothetical protein